MATTERKYPTFVRGHIRDNVILAAYRNSLRGLLSPDTGIAITEDEIQRATQPGSYFWLWADGIDLNAQTDQARGLLLTDQVRPTRANNDYLENVHARNWLGENARLTATGGSGTVDAPATNGTIFPGSQTIGDPAAAVGTDPNGARYQVLTTEEVITGNTVELSMRGVDTGVDTNPVNGTKITWSVNKPLGADDECTVNVASPEVGFSGGFDEETNAELADRVESRMRHKPAGGNRAHFETWARESTVAVESAFVYPIAFNTGSVMVAILQKRGTTDGPLARTSVSVGTYADVVGYLVPPDSPVVPEHAHVLVTLCNSQSSDIVVNLTMGKGNTAGWADRVPWPDPDTDTTAYHAVQITSVTTQQLFEVTTDNDLPGGVASLSGSSAPQLMVWDDDLSRFEKLVVSSVTDTGTNTFDVVLSSAPTKTIAVNDYVSPYSARLDDIAEAVEAYFDNLGPGQVVDLDNSPIAHRCIRFPPLSERYPSRVGQSIISWLTEALGETLADASLEEATRNEPDLPGMMIDGPNIVTLGKMGIYPL